MSRTIPLTRGYVAIVDDEDYEFLSQWKWCAAVKPCGVYAVRSSKKSDNLPKRQSIFIHRVLLGLQPGDSLFGDHVSGNTLDNRRSNLRLATPLQNSRNQRIHYNNPSGAKGVTWHKRDRKWRAVINVGCGQKHIGYFEVFEDAVAARNSAELEIFGEYSRLKREGFN